MSNTATADGSNTSSASDTEFTTVQPIAGLTIVKDDDPDPVDVGESLIYTIDVTNNTGESLSLDLVDDLPNSVDFIAVEPTSPSSSFCEETSGIVTCEINNLAIGATFTAAIAVEPEQEGTIQNTPQLFCDTAAAAGCPSENPDTFTPIAQTTESTVVEDNDSPNDNSPNDDFSTIDDFFPPGVFDDFSPNDDFFDDLEDAENDLNDLEGETTTGETTTGEGTTGNDGGAFADSGDPDDLPPVSQSPNDVVDEINTDGQELPNTPGFPIIAVIIESIICATALVTFWALAVRKAKP